MEQMAAEQPHIASSCSIATVSRCQHYESSRTLLMNPSAMALSVRLCLCDEQRKSATNEDAARSTRNVLVTLVEDVCTLALRFKAQHSLRFAPLILVYAITMCIHIIDEAASHTVDVGHIDNGPRRGVLLRYLKDCSHSFRLADEFHEQLNRHRGAGGGAGLQPSSPGTHTFIAEGPQSAPGTGRLVSTTAFGGNSYC